MDLNQIAAQFYRRQRVLEPLMAERVEEAFGWHLSEQSLEFLCGLEQNSKPSFDELWAILRADKDNDGFCLASISVDTVIDMFKRQQHLPANIVQRIHDQQMQTDPDGQLIRQVIETLRVEKLPWLDHQAEKNHLGHHTRCHSEEIKVRSAYAMAQLGVFHQIDPHHPRYLCDQFLRPIIRFAVECHDYIQGRPGSPALGQHATAEIASAEIVKKWLFSSLVLSPEVRAFLSFQIDYSIVLATTFLFHKTKPRHLFHVFSMFETKAAEAGLSLGDPSNRELIQDTKAVAICIGICDVLAAAISTVAYRQVRTSMNSHSHLSNYFKDQELMLDAFFRSPEFLRYDDADSLDDSIEKFLMCNVPHLLMGAELSVMHDQMSHSDARILDERENRSEKAILIIQFIRDCQRMHSMSRVDFEQFVDHEFKIRSLYDAVMQVFFAMMVNERSFVESLTLTLQFGESELIRYGYLDEHGSVASPRDVAPERSLVFSSDEVSFNSKSKIRLLSSLGAEGRFICSSTAHIDALNLEALNTYALSLGLVKQQQLAKELLLNAVFQAGAFYVACPELARAVSITTSTPLGTGVLEPAARVESSAHVESSMFVALRKVETQKKREVDLSRYESGSTSP